MTAFCELFVAFLLLLSIATVQLLENGLVKTPPMGWMSWGYYMCAVDCVNPKKCLNEELIMSVADSFITDGYQEAGFEYIMIDDCWSEKERRNGKLVPDRKRFPRGMKFLANYIHKRGLKFGMYLNIAHDTCMHYPGSRGHFSTDSKSLAKWDVDYIKVDGCFVEKSYLDTAYIDLGRHLNKTGRPMVYACSWPYYSWAMHDSQANYSLAMKYCNVWRNYYDTFNFWESIVGIIKYFEDQYDDISKYHGPGHWTDPDMLAFGSGNLTEGQSKIQISVYAMLSAPLIMSCPMNRLTKFEKKLLLNQDLIAIDQDPMGIMARPYKLYEHMTIWVKPHLPSMGNEFFSYSFAAVNMHKINKEYGLIYPKRYGLNSTDYTVYDVLLGKFIRNITVDEDILLEVPPMDVVLITLYPI